MIQRQDKVRSFLLLILFFSIDMFCCAVQQELQSPITEDVKDIVLATVHIGDPSKSDQLHDYSSRNNVTMDEIEKLLIDFVEQGLTPEAAPEMTMVLCDFSIDILGQLQTSEAVPVLEKAAKSNNSSRRRGAVRAIVRINDIDTLVFAGNVISNKELYSDLDRHALYEEMANCLDSVEKSKEHELSSLIQSNLFRAKKTKEGEQKILEYMKEEKSDKDEKLRNLVKQWEGSSGEGEKVAKDKIWRYLNQEAILQFLVDVIQRESDSSNIFLLDQKITKVDDKYKMSFLREQVLDKFKNSKVEKHKMYFDKELLLLKEIPKNKRTELKTLIK